MAQVQSLDRELRSHKPHGMAKKIKDNTDAQIRGMETLVMKGEGISGGKRLVLDKKQPWAERSELTESGCPWLK
jgi:hypothetical protein